MLCHPDNVCAAYEKAYADAQVHRAENPSNYKDLNKVQRFSSMIGNHAIPWTWKTLTLVGVGALPGKAGLKGSTSLGKAYFSTQLVVNAPASSNHLRVLDGQGSAGSPVRAPFKSRVAR